MLPSKNRIMPVIVLLLLAIAFTPAHAQTPVPLERITISAGNRADHLVYYRPTTRPQDLTDARTVAYALNESSSVYQPLFGGAGDPPGNVPFQIVFHLTGQPNSEYIAVASWQSRTASDIAALTDVRPPAAPLDQNVCLIEIYTGISGAGNPGASTEADMDVAHEIAHCYQHYYIRAGVDGTVPRRWWVEGGADWLATLVYPAQAPPEDAAGFDYRKSVLINEYDNYYFWQFLASPQGLGSDRAAVNYMVTIPSDIAQFPASLDGVNGTASGERVMHDWSMTLRNRSLTYPAPLDESQFPTVGAAGSGGTTLGNPRFSAGFTRVTGWRIDRDHQAYITVSGTSAVNVIVSVAGSTFGLVELTDDQPFAFCPPSEGITLIHSRGNGDDGLTFVQVEWGQQPSDTPCNPNDNTASCVVGTWVVTDYPVSQIAAFSTVDTSGFMFTFGADGDLSAVYGITAVSGQRTIVANVPYDGTYEVEVTEGGNYLVSDFTLTAQPGGTYTAIDNGVSSDLTGPFYENSRELGNWGPDGGLECDGDIMTWDTQDGSGSFELLRLN